MDHNYDTPPLLTSSDYENLMEELKTEDFTGYGSPLRLEQTYEDPTINSMMQNTQSLPPPPPMEEYGPVPEPLQVESRRGSVTSTTPPELSPSLSPTGTIPSRVEFPGYLDFAILLDSTTSHRRSWLYSFKLNKVFIDMNKSLLVQFKINNFMNGLFVRALPVYEQDDFVSIPVQRCGIHTVNNDPRGQAHPENEPNACYCARYNLVHHVVTCSQPQAIYDYNGESKRHSVVVPLQAPHPGSDTSTVEYQFNCKTSCPRGMSRRAIVLVFTLENEQCEVYGRCVLPVKICSCPKRDKEKEEEDAVQRTSNTPGRGKRRLSSVEKQEEKRLKADTNKQNDVTQETTSDVLKRLEEKIDDMYKYFENFDKRFEELKLKLEERLNKRND